MRDRYTMSGVKPRYTWLDEQKDLIILLYEIGFTAKEIATYFGVTDTPILDRLLEWRVKMRRPGELKSVDADAYTYYGECFKKIVNNLLLIRKNRLALRNKKNKKR